MRYLTLKQIIYLHTQVITQSGGSHGVLNLAGLESAVAQPRMTFGGEDLYPTVVDKAAVLGFCLIQNHPFVDGNKRVGHAAMETFLVLNGLEIDAPVDEQEAVILRVASGEMSRDDFSEWVGGHVVPRRIG